MNIKKVFGCFAAFLLLLPLAFVAVGCNGEKDEAKGGEEEGEIKSLEAVYDEGLLTREELESIAYYYNVAFMEPDADEDFQPIPKDPQDLDEHKQSVIKQAYQEYIFEFYKAEVPTDKIILSKYCGSYHGYTVFGVTIDGDTDNLIGDPFPEYRVDGVIFYWYQPLYVWCVQN